jgi:hypothetical protein
MTHVGVETVIGEADGIAGEIIAPIQVPIDHTVHVARICIVIGFGHRYIDGRTVDEISMLGKDRAEGRNAIREPDFHFGLRAGILRDQRTVRFLREITQDRRALGNDHPSARPVGIHQNRNLVPDVELSIVLAQLFLLGDRDRMQIIGKTGFLDHRARTITVVGRPEIEIEHRPLPRGLAVA